MSPTQARRSPISKTMAPITQASDESNHQALLEQLDVYGVRKPFRKATWRPAMRRNKNLKQMISEASRSQASVAATQNNSGTSTPHPETSAGTIKNSAKNSLQPNIAQASQSLSTYAQNTLSSSGPTGPGVTYTNIESAPSLHPSSQRHYCDITGLHAPYTDPKSRIRYHNGQVFAVVRTLVQSQTESYLATRGAHTVLK